MLSVEKSTIVKASPKDCSAFFREPYNFAKIDRKVRRMKVVEQGPDYAVLDLWGVFGLVFPYWVRLRMDFQPDGGFIAHRVFGPLKAFDAIFTLKPVEEGTLVTHIEAYDFYNLIPGLAERLYKPAVSRIVEEELYRMRRFIEEGWDIEIPWA
jgi:hypothetical protein